MNSNYTLPFVNLLQEMSSKEGTFYREMDFTSLMRKVPFKSSLFTVEPCRSSKPDRHKAKEIWVVKSGKGILEYEKCAYQIASGDILYFDSFKSHQIFNKSNRNMQIISIWWE